MELLIIGGVAALLAGAVGAAIRSTKHTRRRRDAVFGRLCDVLDIPTTVLDDRKAYRVARDVVFHFRTITEATEAATLPAPLRHRARQGWLVELWASLPAELGFEIDPCPPLSARIGDPAFDGHCRVSGDEAEARAVLNAHVRAAVATVAANGGMFDGRSLILPAALRADELFPLQILRDAAFALIAAARYRQPVSLAAIARRDPVPTVRALALEWLVERWPEDPVCGDAVRAGLDDPAPMVRFVATICSGDVDAMLALLDQATGPTDQLRLVTGLVHDPAGLAGLRQRLAALTDEARSLAVSALQGAGAGLAGGVSLVVEGPGALALAEDESG